MGLPEAEADNRRRLVRSVRIADSRIGRLRAVAATPIESNVRRAPADRGAAAATATQREAAIARLTIVGEPRRRRLVDTYQATADRARQSPFCASSKRSATHGSSRVVQHAIAAGEATWRSRASRCCASCSAAGHGDRPSARRARPAARDRPRSVVASGRVRGGGTCEALDSAPEDVREAIAVRWAGEQSTDDALWEDAMAGQLAGCAWRSARGDRGPRGHRAAGRSAGALIEAVSAREQHASGAGRGAGVARAARRRPPGARPARQPARALRPARDVRASRRRRCRRRSSRRVHVVGRRVVPRAAGRGLRAHRQTRDAWQHQLAQAFHAIVQRERMTKRTRR